MEEEYSQAKIIRSFTEVHLILPDGLLNLLSKLDFARGVYLVQVSYELAEPLSVTVFDYGTGTKSSQELMI